MSQVINEVDDIKYQISVLSEQMKTLAQSKDVQKTSFIRNLEELKEAAVFAAKAGVAGFATMEEAASLMLEAHSQGRHPCSVGREYYKFQGKFYLWSWALQARFLMAGGKIKWIKFENTEARAIFLWMGQEIEGSYTWDDAIRAGLATKDTYKKHPKNMLRWRLVSDYVNLLAPQLKGGYQTDADIGHEPTEIDITPVNQGKKVSILESAKKTLENYSSKIVDEADNQKIDATDCLNKMILQYEVSEEITEKWLKRANVSAIDELSDATKSACIKWINENYSSINNQEVN